MEVTIVFPAPPSLNKIIASANKNRYANAQLKKHWTAICANTALSATNVRFPGAVWLDVFITYERATDPDNMFASLKFVLDGLVTAGILVDDSPKIIQSPILYRFGKAPKKTKASISLAISDRAFVD